MAASSSLPPVVPVLEGPSGAPQRWRTRSDRPGVARRRPIARLRAVPDRHLAVVLMSGVVRLARWSAFGDKLVQRGPPWRPGDALLGKRRQVAGLEEFCRPRVGLTATGVPVP